jgi:hypothetical protein
MTKAGERLIRAAQQAREPVGDNWLDDFRQQFEDEFPEDAKARQAVEQQGERPVKEGRFS